MNGKPRNYPSQDRLRELLDYNPYTGLLFWKHKRPGVPYAGAPAGDVKRSQIYVDGSNYSLHIVIYIWITGWRPDPDYVLDHIDLNPYNNREDNLRIATHSNSNMNRGMSKHNTSGIKGVQRYYRNINKKWMAVVGYKGKLYRSYHETKEDAAESYKMMSQKLASEYARYAEASK